MKTINVQIDFGNNNRLQVGELLASDDTGYHVFSYDREFISSNLEISPFHLPLGPGSYRARHCGAFYDLHGVFADSLPDAWGRKVQDAEFMNIGIIEPTALERLAFIGQNGIGALRYHPAREFPKGDDIVNLSALRKAAQKIIFGDADDISRQLLKSGGSAGGARPKFLVDIKEDDHGDIRYTRGEYADGYFPAILKIPDARHDHYQRIEYAYSKIARAAGLNIPDHYLITGSRSRLAFFAMKRFDITPNGSRYHAHTLAGLTNTDYRESCPTAAAFLRAAEDITRDHRQVIEAYKRVAFNYIGENLDDHAKNFTFLMDAKGKWTLAPAYDVGFSKGQSDRHQMRLGQKTRGAEAGDLKALAEDFGISKWDAIIRKMISALKKWQDVAADCGVPEKYVKAINHKLRENIGRVERGMAQNKR